MSVSLLRPVFEADAELASAWAIGPEAVQAFLEKEYGLDLVVVSQPPGCSVEFSPDTSEHEATRARAVLAQLFEHGQPAAEDEQKQLSAKDLSSAIGDSAAVPEEHVETKEHQAIERTQQVAAIAGSPGKRRRVAATPAAMVSVSDLAEVSGLAASSRLSVTAAILDVGTLRDARTGRGSRITTKKVGSVILGSSRCVMQLTVWGDVAERLLPLAQRLVDESPENQFPIVRIQEVMVSKMPATIRDVVKLQGSLSTQLVPTRTCETLQIAPQLHQLVTSFQEIANKAAPFTLHVCGTVVSRSELRFTQQDVPLQELVLCDERGYGVTLVAYDEQAGHDALEVGHRVAVFYAEGRSSPNSTPASVWAFNDSYVLQLSTEGLGAAPRVREMVSLQ